MENAIDDFDKFSLKNIAELVNPIQWPYLPESSHHSKIWEQVIGRSQICLLKRRYFFGAFPESPSVIPPARRSHYYNSTVVFCLRRVSFDILKLVKTKNLEVKET